MSFHGSHDEAKSIAKSIQVAHEDGSSPIRDGGDSPGLKPYGKAEMSPVRTKLKAGASGLRRKYAAS